MVIQLGSIRADAEEIAVIERGAPTWRMPKSQVSALTFGSGSPATKPRLVLGLGVFLVVFGLLPLVPLYSWWVYGGVFRAYTIAWCAWSFLGAWLIRDSFRTVAFLQVDSRGRARRLVLDDAVGFDQIRAFANALYADLGYPVNLQSLQHLASHERT